MQAIPVRKTQTLTGKERQRGRERERETKKKQNMERDRQYYVVSLAGASVVCCLRAGSQRKIEIRKFNMVTFMLQLLG